MTGLQAVEFVLYNERHALYLSFDMILAVHESEKIGNFCLNSLSLIQTLSVDITACFRYEWQHKLFK